MKGNRVLGRGLSALIQGAEEFDLAAAGALRQVRLDQIGFNPAQPRKVFDEERLEELAASIRQVGVLQPVLVRRSEPHETVPRRASSDGKDGEPRFVIIAGERRVRAARLAGLEEIPAVVCTYAESEALRVALLENIQREDLGPIEESEAFSDLMAAYGATQEELAAMLGKKRSTVANALRLLSLEKDIQELLQAGRLTRGHAKALLGMDPGKARQRLARICATRGLSVRETELRVRRAGEQPRPRRAGRSKRRRAANVGESPAIRELRRRTERVLGTPVTIEQDPRDGGGVISVNFYDNSDLERVLALFGVDVDLS